MSSSSKPSKQLDLASLTSYSPNWPPALRFAVCIAVKHASASLCKRVEALTTQNSSNQQAQEDGDEEIQQEAEGNKFKDAFGTKRRNRKKLEFQQDWQDFSQKFVTATCQHLGISEAVLPPGDNTVEDILTISQGRILDDDLQHEAAKKPEETFETGSSYSRLHPELVVLSDSPDAGRPKEKSKESELEKGGEEIKEDEEVAIKKDSEQHQVQEVEPKKDSRPASPQELDPMAASDSEGTEALASSIAKSSSEDQIAAEKSGSLLPSYMRSLSLSSSKKDPSSSEDQPSPSAKIFTPPPPTPQLKRAGGALDPGKEVEVVHELVLVALGLGQFRAEDGATTVWEQDALFGDMDSDVNQTNEEGKTEASSETQSQEKSTSNVDSTQGPASAVSASTNKAWGVLKSGATTSWKGLSSGATIAGKGISSGATIAGRGLADAGRAVSETVAPPRADQPASSENPKGKGKAPVRPNEVCHYDARARAIIFTAVTCMGAKGKEIWMGEKVLAQSIYFLMSEGRNEAKKKTGKDLFEDVPAGAEVDMKNGNINQSSNEQDEEGEGETVNDRKNWMNSISNSVVKKERGKANWGRNAAIAGGFVLGGTIIGLTGGLAAPVIAPALVGLTGASFLASAGGIVMLGTLLGLGGGGLAGYRVKRRLMGVESFTFLEIPTLAQEAGVTIPSLHATICIPGLLLNHEDHSKAFFEVFGNTLDSRDAYLIECEKDLMVEAGKGLNSYVLDQALKSGGQKVGEEILKHTVLAGLAALTLPLTVMGAASAALDGVFARAKTKAHKAGLILADTLRKEVQGHRPVVLVGNSLGAATILSALLELAKNPEENSHLVESVYLIGAPLAPSTSTWRIARRMVSRRFVNCHSSRDMVSAIAAWLGSGLSIEELRSGKMPRVAGSRPILGVPGLENYEVSDIIESHFQVNDPQRLNAVLVRCGALEA